MNPAYNEEYYVLAQRVMGDMLDYAVNTLNYPIEDFYNMFLVSSLSKQIEIGNPTFVAGKNGCEIARLVIEETFGMEFWQEDVMYLDKSPEYWIGWTLAYYQWYSSRSFLEISRIISVKEMYLMYNTLHEADISKTVSIIGERINNKNESILKRLRAYAGLSQTLLARESGVALRQIQMFEQGQRDISKAQADTIYKLSKALKCDMKDLIPFDDNRAAHP